MLRVVAREFRLVQALLRLLDTRILSDHIDALIVVSINGSASRRSLTDITVISSVLPLELPPVTFFGRALAVGAFPREV